MDYVGPSIFFMCILRRANNKIDSFILMSHNNYIYCERYYVG